MDKVELKKILAPLTRELQREYMTAILRGEIKPGEKLKRGALIITTPDMKKTLSGEEIGADFMDKLPFEGAIFLPDNGRGRDK